MKLQIRRMTHGGVQFLLLCDERGVALPGQRSSQFKCSVEEIPEFTVTFAVVPDEIEIVDGEPSLG